MGGKVSEEIKREYSNYRIKATRKNSLTGFKSRDVIMGYSILTLHFAIRSMKSSALMDVTAKVKDWIITYDLYSTGQGLVIWKAKSEQKNGTFM